MAPRYVFTFFDFGGPADVPRLMLAAGGADWEDRRINGAQWADIKPKTTFGQAPLLEIDGKVTISDTGAIIRYIAKEHGFCGADSIQDSQIDSIDSELRDVAFKDYANVLHEKDPQKKDELKKKFVADKLPVICNAIEKILKENNGGQGFLVGDKLTYCDLESYTLCSQLLAPMAGEEVMGKYPLLKGHVDRVGNLPKVKAYMDANAK